MCIKLELCNSSTSSSPSKLKNGGDGGDTGSFMDRLPRQGYPWIPTFRQTVLHTSATRCFPPTRRWSPSWSRPLAAPYIVSGFSSPCPGPCWPSRLAGGEYLPELSCVKETKIWLFRWSLNIEDPIKPQPSSVFPERCACEVTGVHVDSFYNL